MSNLVPTTLTSPGAFGGQTLKTYVSVYEKGFAESQAESPAVQASGLGSSPLTAAQAMVAKDEVELPKIEQPDLNQAGTPIGPMPKKTWTHDVRSGITPEGVHPLDRDRVQACLRVSKGWEAMHPGIPGMIPYKTLDDAVVVEDYCPPSPAGIVKFS